MPGYNSFFGRIENHWDSYNGVRNKYSAAVPIPSKEYFRPIRSIDDFATVAIRPIEKPLYLGFHTACFFIKAAVSLAFSLILAPCALALLIIAPNSQLSQATSSAFKYACASTLVGIAMTAIAALATAVSLFFNPLQIATRVLATGVDCLNSTTEEACGLTIARL